MAGAHHVSERQSWDGACLRRGNIYAVNPAAPLHNFLAELSLRVIQETAAQETLRMTARILTTALLRHSERSKVLLRFCRFVQWARHPSKKHQIQVDLNPSFLATAGFTSWMPQVDKARLGVNWAPR